MNEGLSLTRYRREFIICPLEDVWALTGTAFTSSSLSTLHSFLLGFIEPGTSRLHGSSPWTTYGRDLASPVGLSRRPGTLLRVSLVEFLSERRLISESDSKAL